MKSQAKITFDKASKSHGLMKQVSILKDEVSSLVAKITHFEECDSFLVSIVESVCEMLLCKLPQSLLFYACFGLLLANSLLHCRFALILLLSHVGLLNGSRLLRQLHKGLRAYGRIPVAVVPL
jgi:hypothetical protein